MRRFGVQLSCAAVAAAVFASACGDITQSVTSPVVRPVVGREPARLTAPLPGTCTTLSALIALANQVFGPRGPNANSAIGKLNNMQHQIDIGNYAIAKQRAFDLVQFILMKYKAGGMPGTPAQVVALVNGTFCYAGLAISITDPFNSTIVNPNDPAQTLVATTGTAGTVLPSGAVSEPTVISFRAIVDTFTVPGRGPLHTKLDQYRGFIGLSHQSETNAQFTTPVVVAVCVSGSLPLDVRGRLRLGHDASAGFEITPPADASFLHCPTTTSQVQSHGWLRSLASLVLPAKLYATQDFFSAGVGGTAGEYSDFAPVDPDAFFSAGVGGTAGEYIRLPNSPLRNGSLMSLTSCSPFEGPVGTPVDPACLPFVTLKTPLGTALTGVTVNWNVTAGAGVIAPRTLGVCGAFGSTAVTTTSSFGKAGICWTLGNAGTNTVTATATHTGDAALPGVVITPLTVSFNAIADPPAQVSVVFDQQPPSRGVAGAPFTVSVKVVDIHGAQVMGSSDPVTLTLNQNTFAGGGTTVTANAVHGYVTFSGVKINKFGDGYVLTANGSFITSPYGPVASNTFTVKADNPVAIAIVAGNNQTGPAGSVLPVQPTLLATDQFGNPVSGTSILWTVPDGSPGGPDLAYTVTNTGTGQSGVFWTVGAGANQLRATVEFQPYLSLLFTATGTSTQMGLNECAPGGLRDPITDPGAAYGFYIPNPGYGRTITTELQLYLSSGGTASAPLEYAHSVDDTARHIRSSRVGAGCNDHEHLPTR